MRNLMKGQRQLINADEKVQIKYIQGQINKIGDSVKDRQFSIAWKTVNELSQKKITARAKIKVGSQEE